MGKRAVLIHGDDIAGVFDDKSNASKAGDELFGAVPFFIQRVLEQQQEMQAPALMLGILTYLG